MRRLFGAVLLLWLAGAGCRSQPLDPNRPGAECATEVVDWLQRCGSTHQLALLPVACPKGSAIVEASELRIEITHDRPAFKRAGTIGFSPLGDFPDWSKVEAEKRRALDSLVACVEPVGEKALAAALDQAYSAPPPKRWPWCVALAALLCVVAGRLSAGRWRLHRRQWLPWLVLPVGTFLFRWLTLQPNFFHQAGHGPGFIATSHGSGPLYGPGFVELFGWFVYGRPDRQEIHVFLTNGAYSAMLPLFFWSVVRSAGVRGAFPWVVAAIVATDPLLGRVGFSESYFGAGAALLGGAAAVLAFFFRRTTKPLPRTLAITAAGLLISQAARLHPTTWVAGATMPLVLLVLPGSLGARVGRTIAAALGIGLVVLITSGATMKAVLANPLGHAWAPTAQSHALKEITGGHIAAVIALLLIGLIGLVRPIRPVLLPLFVVTCSLGTFLFLRGMSVKGDAPIYQWATFSQYVAPLLAAIVALPMRLRPNRRLNLVAAGVLAIGGAVALPLRWHDMTELLTDQREARLALQWRQTLPAGAEVWFLANCDQNFRMPLWPADERPAPLPIGHELSEGEFPQPSPELVQQGRAFYYRSSLCSRRKGQPVCETIESRLELEPLQEWELPALFTTGLSYVTPTVKTRLFRIQGVH